MERYDSIIRTYGKENFDKIQNAKLLIVGAGGIGCEILKNLALTGFKYIELIDLDTIDVSNLNRQFLFRPEHVGQPKAIVAGNAAKRFNPDLTVVSYHENIKNPMFNLAYFEKFNLVLNALDNIDARRHVNRLCLAANRPLIDSGTTGYLGQVVPIIKGKTACYECYPKPTQKVYPICTIRSTPDKPVHCIVWAKECFKLLFNQPSESMLFEDESTGETSTYMHLVAYPAEVTVDAVLNYGEALITALFRTEIDKRLEMEVYKTAKVVPAPLELGDIHSAVQACRASLSSGTAGTSAGWDHRIFSLQENILQFLTCLYEVGVKDRQLIGTLSFDKDDLWAMKFVTAASNLRSHVFTIPLLSFHDAKGVAGNIIPAIATTNAIVAGVQVMQAVRLITQENALDAATGESDEQHKKRVQCFCPSTYVFRLFTRKGVLLQPSNADPPVPACFVCGGSEITLQIDVNNNTLGDVVTRVIKAKLGFNEPSIMMGSCFLYEEGDGADEDLQENLPLTLSACPAGGVVDGTVLEISDFTQNLDVRLVVKHVANEELEAIPAAAEDLFIIGGKDALEKRLQADADAAAKAAAQAANTTTSTSATAGDDDDFIVMTDDIQVTVAATTPSATTTTQDGARGGGEAVLGSAHSSTGTLTGGLKRDLAEVHLVEEVSAVEEVAAKRAREA